MRPSAEDSDHLGRARAKRWWLTRRPLASLQRAGGFVEDVGFALLFPGPRLALPSLWEAVAGDEREPFADGMGPAEDRVWAWKDELPGRGLAWYGNFLGGRGSLLSPTLLAQLYVGAGTSDDHAAHDLSPAAHELAAILAGGPMPSAALRKVVGDRNRYQRGIVELQRALLATNVGVEEQKSGWPSAVVDLTCRHFEVGGLTDPDAAALHFMDVVLRATPADLARAFRWPLSEARARLEALVARGRLDGPDSLARYTAVGPR